MITSNRTVIRTPNMNTKYTPTFRRRVAVAIKNAKESNEMIKESEIVEEITGNG